MGPSKILIEHAMAPMNKAPAQNSPNKGQADSASASSRFGRTVRRVTEEFPSGIVQKSSSLFSVLHSKKKGANVQEASGGIGEIHQPTRRPNPSQRSLGQPDPLRSNGISLPQAQTQGHPEVSPQAQHDRPAENSSKDSFPTESNKFQNGRDVQDHENLLIEQSASSARPISSSPESLASDESSGSLRIAQWGIMVNASEAVKARRQPLGPANPAQNNIVQTGIAQANPLQVGPPQVSLPQAGVPQLGPSSIGIPQAGISQNGLSSTGVPQTGISQNGPYFTNAVSSNAPPATSASHNVATHAAHAGALSSQGLFSSMAHANTGTAQNTQAAHIDALSTHGSNTITAHTGTIGFHGVNLCVPHSGGTVVDPGSVPSMRAIESEYVSPKIESSQVAKANHSVQPAHSRSPRFRELYHHFPPFESDTEDLDVRSAHLMNFEEPLEQSRRVTASAISTDALQKSCLQMPQSNLRQRAHFDTVFPTGYRNEAPPAPKKSYRYLEASGHGNDVVYAKKTEPQSRIPLSTASAIHTSSMSNLSSRFSWSSSEMSEVSTHSARPRTYRPAGPSLSFTTGNMKSRSASGYEQHEMTPMGRAPLYRPGHGTGNSSCLSGSPTPKVLRRIEEDMKSAEKYRVSPTPGSRLSKLTAGVKSLGLEQHESNTPPVELRYPTSTDEKITQAMPLGWWSGRLNSQMDKLRNETMLTRLRQSKSSNSFRHVRLTGSYGDGFLDETSCKEYVMRMLREQCITEVALRSYNEFALFLSQTSAFGQRPESPESDKNTKNPESLLPVRRSLFGARKGRGRQ